jgi:hypothetical protein
MSCKPSGPASLSPSSGGPSGQPRSFVSAEGSLSLHMPRPSPPGCPGAVPVLAGPQAPPVQCPADAHSSGGVAVVSRSKCESQAAARCLSFRTRPSILRQAAAAPPSAPGRIQAWSIVRQEYPELVDLAARPRLTRRLGSRAKSAFRAISPGPTSRRSLTCCDNGCLPGMLLSAKAGSGAVGGLVS